MVRIDRPRGWCRLYQISALPMMETVVLESLRDHSSLRSFSQAS